MYLLQCIRRQYLFAGLAYFALATQGAAAQESTESVEIANFQLAIGSAINRAIVEKNSIATPLKQLQKEATTFEKAMNSGRVLESNALTTSLILSTNALRDIQPALDSAQSELVVRALLDDIKLKNEATDFTYRLNGASRPTPEVTVHINVIKNGNPIAGYGVILVPQGYREDRAWEGGKLANIPSGASVSSQFTPNALATVLPGVYWVQVYKVRTLLASIPMQVKLSTDKIDVSVP